jgi:hypothetical protein
MLVTINRPLRNSDQGMIPLLLFLYTCLNFLIMDGGQLCFLFRQLYIAKVARLDSEIEEKNDRTVDQITRKTPNPESRLYWCLIEFIDWRHTSHFGVR